MTCLGISSGYCTLMKSISELNQLCQVCITSTDYQEKTNAEQLLSSFCKSLQPNNLSQLFQQVDQTSLLVVLSLLLRDISNMSTPVEWLKSLLEIYSQWMTEDIEMVRLGIPLQSFIVNTCRQFGGQLTKLIYYSILSNSNVKEEFQKYIVNLNQPVRLFLYIGIIESMNLIDYQLGFLCFRNLLFNFQKDWIPIMFREAESILRRLSDYDEFTNIIQGMDTQLNMSDSNSQPKESPPFSNNEYKVAVKLTQLLQNLTQFNYNITASEYQKQVDFDDCPVQFPLTVVNIIVKEGLYRNAQSVVKRLVTQFPDDPLTESFLRCFIKLSSPAVDGMQFKRSAIQACIFMMGQKVSPPIMYILLDLNVKLIKNIVFHSFFSAYTEVTIRWMRLLVELSGWILKNTVVSYRDVNAQNVKTIFNIIFTASGKKELLLYRSTFEKVSEKMFQQLCDYLFGKDRCLIAENVTDSMDMEQKNREYFSGWVSTIFQSYQVNIVTMQNVQKALYSKVEGVNNLTNFNLMLGYLVDQYIECFKYNIYLEDYARPPRLQFGLVIRLAYQTLSEAVLSPSLTLHSSIIYFYNKFLQNILESVQSSEDWNSTFITDFAIAPKQNTQALVMESIKHIGRWLLTNDESTIIYSFRSLHRQTERLNRIYQGRFNGSALYQQLIHFYLKVARENLRTSETIRCRKYLFQNITLMVFYEVKCSYRETINDLLAVISSDAYETQLLKVLAQLYDIRGIASSVTSGTAISEIVDIATPVLLKLNKMVFEGQFSFVLVKKALRLYNCLLLNTGGRYFQNDGELVATTVYNMVLPYWAQMLNQFNKSSKEGLQKSIQIVAEVFKGFGNVYREELCNPLNQPEFANLVASMFTAALRGYDTLTKLPQQMLQVVLFFELVTRPDMLEAILEVASPPVIKLFFQFHALMIRTLIEKTKIISKEKEPNDKEMHPSRLICDGVVQMYTFFKKRALTLPLNMRALRCNKIEANINLFIQSDKQNVMSMAITELFRASCCFKSFSQVFQLSVKVLSQLLSAYPVSFDYVNTSLKFTFQNLHSEDKLAKIFKSAIIVRPELVVSYQPPDSVTSNSDNGLESLLIDWIKAMDNTNTPVNEY